MDERRFSAVCWLSDDADLRAMGEPEFTKRAGDYILHGLWIPEVGLSTKLLVKADTTGRITVAIEE